MDDVRTTNLHASSRTSNAVFRNRVTEQVKCVIMKTMTLTR